MDPTSAEPDATKTVTMTMPLTDGVAGETLWVYALGFAFLDGGAGAEGNGYLNIVSIDIGIR